MTFQPIIPFGGLQGWMYLDRTYEVQLESFSAQARLQRDVAYFKEQIGTITSASDLVQDRRLREVALGAFGLSEDMPNIYFVQRILGDGVQSDDALGNRLADTRYREFSAAFGLGPGEFRQTGNAAAMAEIADLYLARSFEEAVGQQDDTMRISLNAKRELAEIATGAGSENAKWYTILGQPPLRALFETALGFPPSFGQADLERQLTAFQDRLASMTGSNSIAQFEDPEAVDQLITVYQARAQIQSGAISTSPAATALALLSGR
ncbi:MAG: DUF1217 domain-containing protein [Paracoccaceae bacterium]